MTEPAEEVLLTNQPATPSEPSRRQVLSGLAVALLAPGAFAAACGGSGSSGAATTTTTAPTTTGSGAGTTTTGSSTGGTVLAKVSDVPVGGGIIVNSPSGRILLVQLTAGTVKAYDPTCTHQAFEVGTPQDGVITCLNPGPNHGSQFNAADGSVRRGPAADPLATVPVKISGDSVVLG